MGQSKFILIFSMLGIFLSCDQKQETQHTGAEDRPNVIFVMTDDQGIGDLACHGNPWISTPNIDKFYSEAIRLTDFHASPLCTPTRSALMTGLYPINNGVWATFKGRDFLHKTTPLLPEIFKEGGYNTAMFGKWHLGDNYPSRATDRGFDTVYQHSAGGVGELSDYWGNDYFDDTYLVNNQPESFEGYCTDVWFDEAINFIKNNQHEPFFIYLPTNAPHHPLYVDEKYADPYRELVDKEIYNAEFYGMLTNIDENFGKLDRALEELGLDKNTIVVFCSDNGSQFGVSPDYTLGWNKGFKGRKNDILEAGHRVPFFIRWPQKGLAGGKDLDALTVHVDVLPTLADLCDIELPSTYRGDGLSLAPLLLDNDASTISDRTAFVHFNQDYRKPDPILGSCIMNGPWRLLDGSSLYNIQSDPLQEKDLSSVHPEIVERLLSDNKAFVQRASERTEYQNFAYAEAGNDLNSKIKLTVQHAMGEDEGIWKQEQIAAGVKNKNASHPVSFLKKGRYKITCMRWPEEHDGPILGIPESALTDTYTYSALDADQVEIKVYDKVYTKKIEPEDHSVVFDLNLEAGHTLLESNFLKGNEKFGVYYTYIELIN